MELETLTEMLEKRIEKLKEEKNPNQAIHSFNCGRLSELNFLLDYFKRMHGPLADRS